MRRTLGFAVLVASVLGCGSIAEDEPDGTADGPDDVSGESSPDAADAEDGGDVAPEADGDGTEADVPVEADALPEAEDGGTAEVVDAADTIAPTCGDGEVDSGEECDDGNAVPGDGCEPDCTFTCVGPIDCDDGNPCTDELCDADRHTCSNPYADHACDDGDSCTLGDWCERGDCVPEATLPWGYPDRDGDGFGDLAFDATCGEGFVPDGTDCCDSALVVNPAQTGWFMVPAACGSDGGVIWDYNCSGTVETQYGNACARCEGTTASTCRPAVGWQADATGEGCVPPACGVYGHWLEEFTCTWDPAGARCTMSGANTPISRRQGCH